MCETAKSGYRSLRFHTTWPGLCKLDKCYFYMVFLFILNRTLINAILFQKVNFQTFKSQWICSKKEVALTPLSYFPLHFIPGADIDAVDSNRGACAQDWAFKTGRFEVIQLLRRLAMRPKAGQFCESYVPEWPELKERVAKARAHKSPAEKITLRIKNTFGFSFPQDPQDNGVMDHMVRMTTSIHSPLVSTGCRPLCPTSPPEMGKRRVTVQELMKKHPQKELEVNSVCHSNGCMKNPAPSGRSAETVSALCCPDTDRRGSILSLTSALIPRSIARRNSVFPSGFIPDISVDRPSDSTPKKEKKRKNKGRGKLEPPMWTYKEQQEEKNKDM